MMLWIWLGVIIVTAIIELVTIDLVSSGLHLVESVP